MATAYVSTISNLIFVGGDLKANTIHNTIEYDINFMTRVVYEFSLHDVDRERLSIFPES